MFDPHSQESRGFAFVTMKTSEEADAAIAGLNGTDLGGKTMRVEKVSLVSRSSFLPLFSISNTSLSLHVFLFSRPDEDEPEPLLPDDTSDLPSLRSDELLLPEAEEATSDPTILDLTILDTPVSI